MDWYNLIKGFYPRLWSIEWVADAVACEKITKEEYKLITGSEYEISEPQE